MYMMIKIILTILIVVKLASCSNYTLDGQGRPILGNYTNVHNMTHNWGRSEPFDNYMLIYNTMNNNSLSVGLVCQIEKASNWCGFGFSYQGDMTNSPVSIFTVDDDGVGFGTEWKLYGKDGPWESMCEGDLEFNESPCPDITLNVSRNCCNDMTIVNVTRVQENNIYYIIAEYFLPLEPQDVCDYTITEGEHFTVYAQGGTFTGGSPPWHIQMHAQAARTFSKSEAKITLQMDRPEHIDVHSRVCAFPDVPQPSSSSAITNPPISSSAKPEGEPTTTSNVRSISFILIGVLLSVYNLM